MDGYYNFRIINNRLCCLNRFLFTVGLLHDLDEEGYRGRWCFATEREAADVLANMTEIPDDRSKLPGKWIKYKGQDEDGTYQEVSFMN